MQSIDINLLISGEQVKQSHSTDNSFVNSFESLFVKNRKACLISNKVDPNAPLYFALKTSKSNLSLIEVKADKGRSFNIDFGSQYFTVGKRRGFKDDVIKLKDRLTYALSSIIKKPPTMWFHFDDKTDLETTPLKQQVADSFKLDMTHFSEIKKNQDKVMGMFSLYLKSFIKSLIAPIASKNCQSKLNDKISDCKKLFLEMLGHEPKLVISNIGKKKATINSVYTLVVTPTHVSFIEKSSMSKTSIILNFEHATFTLNNDPLTLTSFEWFSKKINGISQDIYSNKATILVKE